MHIAFNPEVKMLKDTSDFVQLHRYQLQRQLKIPKWHIFIKTIFENEYNL